MHANARVFLVVQMNACKRGFHVKLIVQSFQIFINNSNYVQKKTWAKITKCSRALLAKAYHKKCHQKPRTDAP